MTASRTLAYLDPGAAKKLAASFSELITTKPIDFYYRIYPDDPGYDFNTAGTGLSRFSSLRDDYTVIYAASNLETALYEARIRDSLDLSPVREISVQSLEGYVAVGIGQSADDPFNLIDLTDGRAALQGVPTDVLRWSQHDEGPHFSQFIHDHIPGADGIYYLSRFTERPCVALFQDRVENRLRQKRSAVGLARSRAVWLAISALNITLTK